MASEKIQSAQYLPVSVEVEKYREIRPTYSDYFLPMYFDENFYTLRFFTLRYKQTLMCMTPILEDALPTSLPRGKQKLSEK